MLQVLIENLLQNAWKYSSKKEKARIEFGEAANEKNQIFYVKDNGAGFDMTYSDKLFGAFQRLHGTDEYPGTGIGLALVKRIICRHGGDVWAEGEVSVGSTFYFSIPKQRKQT